MKKTMIIALLVVLVLGVFTACNGNVDEELFGKKGEPVAEKTITLAITGYDWYFDEEHTKKATTITFPGDKTEWNDLCGLVQVSLYYYYEETTYDYPNTDLTVQYGGICFDLESDPFFVCSSPESDTAVSPSDSIDADTYYLKFLLT